MNKHNEKSPSSKKSVDTSSKLNSIEKKRIYTSTMGTSKIDARKIRKKGSSWQVLFVIYMFIIIFLGMMAYLIYFQTKDAKKLADDYRNPKLIARQKNIITGNIYANDANTILATNKSDSKERSYPQGEVFAHPIGYSQNGRTGMEATFYKELLSVSDDSENLLDKVRLEEKKTMENGNSIISTLSVDLQATAYNAMGGRKGAVVVMEADTGKVLTMTSKPSYNPNTVKEDWKKLVSDSQSSPLLNRAIQGLYAPGSTFKVLTGLEYIREHADYESYSYTCPSYIERYGHKVSCAFGKSHGKVDIKSALEVSCNGAFIDMGLKLDIDKYVDFVESFGFNSDLDIADIPVAKSRFELTTHSPKAEVMQTVFGQGNTLVTPIQNCLIAQAIANHGEMLEPKLVDRVIDENKSIVKEYKSTSLKKVIQPIEASIMKEYMTSVVNNGLAKPLKNSKYSVAVKTGTAQYNNNKNTHNLIIGFAPADNPKIAFSIVLEGYEGQPDIDNDLFKVTRAILNEYFR